MTRISVTAQRMFNRQVETETHRLWVSSPLGRWMQVYRDEIETLVQIGAMDWSEAAKGFATVGLIDARRRMPDAATAEETWWHVSLGARAACPQIAMDQGPPSHFLT